MRLEEFENTIDKFSSKLDQYISINKTPKLNIDEKEDDTNTIDFKTIIKEFAKELYQCLNLSILEADYINDDKFESKLKTILERISDFILKIDENSLEEESQILYNFIKFLKHDINNYIDQIYLFRKSLNNPTKILVDYESKVSKSLKNDELEIRPYSEIFQLNLDLMFYDREFIIIPQAFLEINRICHRLNKLESNTELVYIQALIHKCKILEGKFYYTDNFSYYLNYFNYYKGNEESIDLKIEEKGLISQRIKEINTRDTNKYKYNITNYFSSSNTSLNSFDYFIRCHYYKNVEKNGVALQKLIENFKNIKDLSDFDKFNYEICLNYFNNCHFSFELSNRNITPNDVKTKLEALTLLQKDSGVCNYFPYYKASLWYREYIEREISLKKINKELIEHLTSFKECINKANEVFLLRKYNVGSFIPFKPFFNECIEKFTCTDGLLINIFISTSFIIPVDYKKVKKQIKELESDYLRLRAILESSISITDLSKRINTQLEDADKKIDAELTENQKNSIQILAIFAGIVMFTSGTIQIFTESTSIKEASMFMLMFASSLGTVGLLIRNCLVTKKEINKRDYIYVITLITIIIISAFGAFSDWGYKSFKNKQIPDTDSMIVSINPLQINVDTINVSENHQANIKVNPIILNSNTDISPLRIKLE